MDTPMNTKDDIGIGVIGAGNFARLMLPAIQKCRKIAFRTIVSARGITAQSLGKEFGFSSITTDESSMLNDQDIDSVFFFNQAKSSCITDNSCFEGRQECFHVEKPLAISNSRD